jgi:hypothetical protein
LVRVRTALDIDEDILRAASEIAVARNLTAGAVISALVREPMTSSGAHSERVIMNGLRVVPPAGRVVTNEMVRKLRESGV